MGWFHGDWRMTWIMDIDARRITGLADGATVYTIADQAANIELSSYAGTNLPTFALAHACVSFNPSNSEMLSDQSLPSSFNSAFQSNSFFHALRAKVSVFGSISYTSSFGSASSGNPIISLRFGTNDPSNFIRSTAGIQAAPSSIDNLMTAGQMYTIYIRGDGTNVYFGVDDPIAEGGTREQILTGNNFPGTAIESFALGALLRSSASFSGSTAVLVQGAYLWSGAVDASARDTLLAEIANGPIGAGGSVSRSRGLARGIGRGIGRGF